MNRVFSIDLYKFLLSIIIVVLHSNFQFLPQGYLAVESFFIIAGFVLYFSEKDIKLKTFYDNVKKKIIQIYPMYAIMILIFSIRNLIRGDALLLKQLPVYLTGLQVFSIKGMEYGYVGVLGYLWYIPVYILVNIILTYLTKYKQKRTVLFLCLFMVIGSTSLLAFDSPSGGVNYTIEKFNQPFAIGLLRGFISMPLGYMLAYVCEKINIKSHKISITLLVTCVEITLLLYEFYVLTHEVSVLFDYSYIIASVVFVLLLYKKVGYVSKLMEFIGKNRIIYHIIKLSTAIYFVHMLFVDEYIYNTGGFVEKKHIPIILLTVFAGACVLYGINKIIQTKIKSYMNSDLAITSEK